MHHIRNPPCCSSSPFLSPHNSVETSKREDAIKIRTSASSALTIMPITASTASTSALSGSLFRRPAALLAATPRPSWLLAPAAMPAARRSLSCQVAIATDVSSSSPDAIAEEEAEAAAKIGAKIRVTAPIKVYHVMKVPELDLCGMEGVIKQYVGVWKGKRLSANFPFKVEFFVSLEGQEKPVKFVVHLREDEFEYLSCSD
ncbi:ferredoxin-thioredoxin reductase, variable chain, chloroplastic-like [Phalaenopsis equestris]|uniref:ferredoxin-thioredoxin reductase, variable chain, chloroplastic-like n=1 Tax=Phalaenopsis equestris TaxID=78828 RepID=UPI0009E21844|nr:ferredoxin-thioredoxin reductase, variable chain, chloroplastic-like [Phalaenopsis equestris]